MKTFLLLLLLSTTERAELAWNSLVNHYWEDTRSDFRGENHYWHYAQSFDIAAMDPARAGFIETLYQAQKKRGYFQTGTIFYDDENWMALALIRAYQATKNENYLRTATDLFADVMKAEVKDPDGSTRGVRWNSQSTGVATASNMGAVITAALLHGITQEDHYLVFAERIYSHWKETMLVKDTYQVVDFRKPDGTREYNLYTYDQGLMIGAAVELFRITKQDSYLEDARGIAGFISSRMTSKGVLVEPKCFQNHSICKNDNDVAQFKGITVKFLVELAKVDPENDSVRALLDTTITSLWEKGRDPKTDLFTVEWDGTDTLGESSYGAANSAAMALGAYAEL